MYGVIVRLVCVDVGKFLSHPLLPHSVSTASVILYRAFLMEFVCRGF